MSWYRYEEYIKYGLGSVVSYLSGTQLFLLDSLTAGPGNIISVPYYIAKSAYDAGRLRNLWVRPVLATTATTATGISSLLGSLEQSESEYCPSAYSLSVDGTAPTDVITMSTSEFPWATARIYYLKSSGGGSFDITFPLTLSVDMTGTDNEIGYVEITNPDIVDTTAIKIANLTSGNDIAGFLLKVADISEDYLDVINFARSGQNTEEYNACLNIADWYAELGVTGAIINSGTNDSSYGKNATLIQFKEMLDNLTNYGLVGDAILLIRPNDNAKNLGDLWEDARDYAGTRFTSIVRIYGDYDTFYDNGWMADGDSVHPDDVFNEIQADPEYKLELVSLHDALDLGVEPHWMTTLSTTTYMELDSDVVLSGDFSGSVRFYWPTGRACIIMGSSRTTENFTLSNTGRVGFRINNVKHQSDDGLLTEAGWYTINFSRVGSQLTIDVISVDADGLTPITIPAIDNASADTSDFTFNWVSRYAYGYNVNGITAWLSLDGLHKWIFDQDAETDTIIDLVGSNDATWMNKLSGVSNVIKYSIMSDGTLLDYHYNLPTDYVWGTSSWLS